MKDINVSATDRFWEVIDINHTIEEEHSFVKEHQLKTYRGCEKRSIALFELPTKDQEGTHVEKYVLEATVRKNRSEDPEELMLVHNFFVVESVCPENLIMLKECLLECEHYKVDEEDNLRKDANVEPHRFKLREAVW